MSKMVAYGLAVVLPDVDAFIKAWLSVSVSRLGGSYDER